MMENIGDVRRDGRFSGGIESPAFDGKGWGEISHFFPVLSFFYHPAL
jgi:hypothetical protein